VFKQRLESLLEAALSRVHGLEAIKPIAMALLNLDPSNERACRRLMLAYAEQGDVAGALRTYKDLWELLGEEYDSEPTQSTQDLVVKIKRGDIAGPAEESKAENPSRDEMGPAHGHRHALSPQRMTPTCFSSRSALRPADVRVREWRRPRAQTLSAARLASGPGCEIGPLSRVDGSRWRCIRADFTRPLEGKAARYFGVETIVGEDDTCVSLTLTIKTCRRAAMCGARPTAWRPTDGSSAAEDGRSYRAGAERSLSAERLMSTARQPDVSLGAYERWLRVNTSCSAGVPPTARAPQLCSGRLSKTSPDLRPFTAAWCSWRTPSTSSCRASCARGAA